MEEGFFTAVIDKRNCSGIAAAWSIKPCTMICACSKYFAYIWIKIIDCNFSGSIIWKADIIERFDIAVTACEGAVVNRGCELLTPSDKAADVTSLPGACLIDTAGEYAVFDINRICSTGVTDKSA